MDGVDGGRVEQASERILLIRLSAVGDVVNTLPMLSLLREARPDAFIGFVVEDKAADLLLGHPLVDRVHVFRRRDLRAALGTPIRGAGSMRAWRLLRDHRRDLREAHYDVAIDVQGNLKGALHLVASGASRRVGFARGYGREASHLFVNERIVPPTERPHRVDKFVSLLSALGIAGTARHFVLPWSPAAAEAAERWLTERGLSPGGFVMLHPGTSERGSGKRWPVERFGELARRLAEMRPDAPGRVGPGAAPLRTLVSWGPGEEELARAVVLASGENALLSPCTQSLLELAELSRRAAAFVSADTGPMHLAAACGTPCVALFGPKDPRIYRPWGEQHRVLASPPERGGMISISVDDVLAALAPLLASARTRAAHP